MNKQSLIELKSNIPDHAKLSYVELMQLRILGVINLPSDEEGVPYKMIPEEQVQPASIDVTLSSKFFRESSELEAYDTPHIVDIAEKHGLWLDEIDVPDGESITLAPGEFILASTREFFDIPNFMVAEYRLNSSLGRVGLNHALAAFADPGWHGSSLTLELRNDTKNHELVLTPGMKIGQMIFETVTPVPDGKCYRSRGQYNNQVVTQPSKGLRTGE